MTTSAPPTASAALLLVDTPPNTAASCAATASRCRELRIPVMDGDPAAGQDHAEHGQVALALDPGTDQGDRQRFVSVRGCPVCDSHTAHGGCPARRDGAGIQDRPQLAGARVAEQQGGPDGGHPDRPVGRESGDPLDAQQIALGSRSPQPGGHRVPE